MKRENIWLLERKKNGKGKGKQYQKRKHYVSWGDEEREKEKKSSEKEKDLLKEERALKVLVDLKRKFDSYIGEIINDSS